MHTYRDGGYALVIDGAALRAALHDDLKMLFLTVSVRCKAVICCRVTPSQKALVSVYVCMCVCVAAELRLHRKLW